jgi:PAS domain S-box-containing protein
MHLSSDTAAQMSRLAAIVESSDDAIIGKTLDGTVTDWNHGAERMYGYPAGEMLGRSVLRIFPPDLAPELEGILARIRLGERVEHFETRRVRKDGTTIDVSVSISPIRDQHGVIAGAATVARDITEHNRAEADRERLERQLQQSQRLESLGQLAGGVAHDFNNLLSVITGYASFAAKAVQKDAPPGPAPAVLADIEQIQAAAARAAVLTRQLLTFARREVVQPRVLNLNEVVTNVLKLLQRTIGEHVVLATELDAKLDPVLADPGQFEQILVNLAVNARDAMPEGGTLTIQTGNIDLNQTYADRRANLSAGPYVALKVSDTGTGMPADVAARAFEPFFTTKPEGEATGLGLATTYGIVTQAGGTVRIYSEPGLGTIVTVLMPVTDDTAPSEDRLPGEPQGGEDELVLVVEDEPALREVTRRTLVGNGYRVIAADTGQGAIDAVAASAERIDVLLTDVVMPGMQGCEVAKRICELQPGIGVLFMSGYTQGLLSTQGLLEPGINLIEKPFTEASLLTRLRAVIRAREAI